MDIRIGNDICVQIPISEFGAIDPDDIKEIRCTFINQHNAWHHDCKFHPAFHCSTKYTIHSYDYHHYNVYPHGPHMHMLCTNNNVHCGPVDCSNKFFHDRFESYCNISNNFINAYFPAEFLKNTGSYKCVFEIKVDEEGWDCDDLHTYTSSYDHVFNLKKNGILGRTIIINPVDEKKYDTYICSMTEEELLKYKDDYTKLIPISEGFKFSNLPGFKKNITIGDENKKIVIISKYNSLLSKLDSYSIPMNMIKQDDDHYVYISKDSYSNRLMSILIVNQLQSNPEYVEPVRTLKDKSDWLIVAQPSVNPDTINRFGATVFFRGTVKRTIVYEWSDGRPNDIEEEEIVLLWSYISSDGRRGDVIGSLFSVGSYNNKQRTFTFTGRTNSELGDDYITDGFTVTQISQPDEPEQPEDPIETGITYGIWSANSDCKATPSEIDTIGRDVILSGSASRVNVRHFSDGSSENTTETTQLLWKYIDNNGNEFDVEEGQYSIGVWTDDNSEHKLRHYFTGYTSNPNGTNATFKNLVCVTLIRHNYIDHISDITLSNSNRYEGSINLSIHGSFTGFNPVSSTCEEVKVENGVLKFVVPENEDNFAKEHIIRLYCFPDGYSISFKITQPAKIETTIVNTLYGSWSLNDDISAIPGDIETTSTTITLSGTASRTKTVFYSDGSSVLHNETTTLRWKYEKSDGTTINVGENNQYTIGSWSGDNSEHEIYHTFTGYTDNPNGTNRVFENIIAVTLHRYNYINPINDITLPDSNVHTGSIVLPIEGLFTNLTASSSSPVCTVNIDNGTLNYTVKEKNTSITKKVFVITIKDPSDNYSVSFKITQPAMELVKMYAYYGASSSVENMISEEGDKKEITGSETKVSVQTLTTDGKMVHWCAVPTGYEINTITCNNSGDTNVRGKFSELSLSNGYTYYYYVASRIPIQDTTNFIITKA